MEKGSEALRGGNVQEEISTACVQNAVRERICVPLQTHVRVQMGERSVSVDVRFSSVYCFLFFFWLFFAHLGIRTTWKNGGKILA